MSEIYPIREVLEKIQNFSQTQRVLLAQSGTLQGTLSAYFNSPVEIKVKIQEAPREKIIHREIELVCDVPPVQAVCIAKTSIFTTSSRLIKLINAKELGLGQIMQQEGIKPNFRLKAVGSNSSTFWRHYILDGVSITYEIHEEFPLELYK